MVTLLLSLCYCQPSQYICVDLANSFSLVALFFKPRQIADLLCLINFILFILNLHYILFYVFKMWLSFHWKRFLKPPCKICDWRKGPRGNHILGNAAIWILWTKLWWNDLVGYWFAWRHFWHLYNGVKHGALIAQAHFTYSISSPLMGTVWVLRMHHRLGFSEASQCK